MFHINDLRCGNVLIAAPFSEGILNNLENLYKKRVSYKPFEAHTFGIFLTKQKVSFALFGITYGLIWKPFFGVRWLRAESFVNTIYTRIKKKIDGVKLNLDLGFQELELKQDSLHKWPGDVITDKMIDYVLRKDTTERFQTIMEEVALKVETEEYEPEEKLLPTPKKLQDRWMEQ
jgi:hypothetical protein